MLRIPTHFTQIHTSVGDPHTIGSQVVQLFVTDLVSRYAGRPDHPPPRHSAAVLTHDRAHLPRAALTDVLGDVSVRRDAAGRDRLHRPQHGLDVLVPVHGPQFRPAGPTPSPAARAPTAARRAAGSSPRGRPPLPRTPP